MKSSISPSRYDRQGELQTELTEKIAFCLGSIKNENRIAFANDIYELLSLAVYGTQETNDKWEMLNSRMGQYLASYYKDDTDNQPVNETSNTSNQREKQKCPFKRVSAT